MAQVVETQVSDVATTVPLAYPAAVHEASTPTYDVKQGNAASITSDGSDFEKQSPPDGEAQLPDLSKTVSTPEYPATPQVVAIMVAILLAVFLIALVCYDQLFSISSTNSCY